MKRFLVFVRAGDESLHLKWLAGKRNFDLFVSYYGDQPGNLAGGCDYYEAVKGLKWPVIANHCSSGNRLFSGYDAVWFPDDDLATTGSTVSTMFELFVQHDLWLGQPALDENSHVWHPVTRKLPEQSIHFSEFVEVMCPIFSRNTLKILSSTFTLSASGYGLDFLWPHLLNYPASRIGILDETTVCHTRPFRTGPVYALYKKMGVDPDHENVEITRRFGLSRKPRSKVLGSIPLGLKE